MNKYIEAWNRFKTLANGARKNYYMNYTDSSAPMEADKKIIDELVDKATPKKVIKSDIHDGICPLCGKDLIYQYRDIRFCQGTKKNPCGQVLDWSEDDE